MKQAFIQNLDKNLKCVEYKIKKEKFILIAESIETDVKCPFCGETSSKIHSIYQREIQDIPIQDKQAIILLNTRKMFCLNENCTHRTFSERFDFVAPNGKKTNRLLDKIMNTSTKLSSVTASALLKNSSIKKMPTIVDKSSVTKICVDDFAFRKRYTYGTVMVDLDTHKIIDIIDSRETKIVEDWLRSYPNLKVVSRDGAHTYSSAVSNAHPDAIQISDRFHLIKNLSDAVERYLHRLFPSRLIIPTDTIDPEMEALYDTRNRAERIIFAQKKHNEGYTANDIALLLHSSVTTIRKYLSIQENEIPEVKENARERQHLQQLKNKKLAIDEVKKLYAEGHSIDEIMRLTGHTTVTIRNYLKDEYIMDNGHYDNRIPGKLAPYEQKVITMRSKGITYKKIHEQIVKEGYTGTIASLRMFMQKERTHQRSISKNITERVEYIPRKLFCQLIYRELENIKGLTKEQYNASIKKYPVLGQLYSLIREYHRIIFSQKSEELETWITQALSLQIDEVETYVNGLLSDIDAVKNAIKYKYNNGLAEGSVNKIKLTKRIMYGRNSFELLKAKLLLNEIQIN